jgi:hypothetical protein
MEKDDLSKYQKRKEYLKEYRKKNKEKIKEYRNQRKEINNNYHKEYEEKNKESLQQYRKTYREKNKEKNIKYLKEYYLNNKEKSKAYRKENIDRVRLNKRTNHTQRIKTDPLYKLTHNVRGLIRQSIIRNQFTKKTSTIKILGCSYDEFKNHIENHFEPWMNWENYGKYNGEFNYGWDIDHIIPSSSAKCEEDVYKLNHYTNLQPLCSKINRDLKKNFSYSFVPTSQSATPPAGLYDPAGYLSS